MLQQHLHGHATAVTENAKNLAELQNQMDCSYNDLHEKFGTLNSKFKPMENKGTSTSSTQYIGHRTGKYIHHSKDFAHAHAITLRSGKELPKRQETTMITKYNEVQDGEDPCPKED